MIQYKTKNSNTYPYYGLTDEGIKLRDYIDSKLTPAKGCGVGNWRKHKAEQIETILRDEFSLIRIKGKFPKHLEKKFIYWVNIKSRYVGYNFISLIEKGYLG